MFSLDAYEHERRSKRVERRSMTDLGISHLYESLRVDDWNLKPKSATMRDRLHRRHFSI